MNIKYISKGFVLLACLILTAEVQAKLNSSLIDSIGIENNNEKQVVLHRVEAKESYYSLSRKYVVHPKDIIAFNNNKSLKVGDIVKVPTNRPFASSPIVEASDTRAEENINPIDNNDNSIQYRVGARETLYTIAKRFNVSVSQIVQRNNLRNNTDIKSGQTIYIPKGNAVQNTIQTSEEEEEEQPGETVTAEKTRTVQSSRYGLTQVDEKGVGVWMDGLNADGANMLALHKTAPIGTVVKITNPMTQKSTFAKIVGKYTDNSNTRDAVIVISKNTANLLGILDKRFLINISYGMPN